MEDYERISLAREARTLMHNPAIIAALAAYRQRVMDDWAKTPALAMSAREDLHAEIRALTGVERALSAIQADGAAIEDRNVSRRIQVV